VKSQRLHTKWVSFRNTPLFCIDLSGCEAGDERFVREIQMAEQIFTGRPAKSMLVALDLSLTRLTPEICAFIRAHAGPADPLRKLAVMGLSGFQRAWLRLTHRLAWPENTAFFKEYERAKEWLVSEGG
jgi:hypothetical protein